VQCVWRLRAPAAYGAAQAIYPDGRCEIIVHLGSPPRCWDAQRGWHEQAPTLFAAQRISAVRLAGAGMLDCLGVRLQPAASGLVAARRLRQLRDHIVDLACMDAQFSRHLTMAMQSFARGAGQALWELLVRRCESHPVDPRIEAAAARLSSSCGRARIDALARSAGMSMRGFQTRFHSAVGLAPKEFARLERLQATLRALDEHQSSIANLAVDRGFADQAHATRELRRMTGLTPARLRAQLRDDRDADAAIRLAAAFVRGRAV